MFEIRGKYNTAKVFTDVVENSTISHITSFLNLEYLQDSKVRIMPDCHDGKGCVIGTTMTITDKAIPSVIGCDVGCLDAESEFLTPLGWKKICDYNIDDLVLQYDPYDNKAKFVKPNSYIKLKCDTFNEFNNGKSLDMAVCDNHRILIYKGYKSKGYTYDDYYAHELNNIGDSLGKGYYTVKTTFELDQEGLDVTNEELMLRIAISADARIRDNIVEFHLKKQRKIERLMYLLDRLHIEFKSGNRGNESISIWFKNNGRFNKDLTWIYKLNSKQTKIVANESLLWDGYK